MTRPVLSFLLVALAGAPLSRADEPNPSELARRALAEVESTWAARQPDSAHARAAAWINSARAAPDTTLLVRLLVMDGGMWTALGHGRDAEVPLREALALSEATGDSANLSHTLRWLGPALDLQGRTSESREIYRRLVDVAGGLGLTADRGWGLCGLGVQHLQEGNLHAARDYLERSVATFEEAGVDEGQDWVSVSLAQTHLSLGEFDEAVRVYESAARRSHERGAWAAEANALNDLGVLRHHLGDPEGAAADFRRAFALHEKDGNLQFGLAPAINIANAESQLGHFAEAERILTDLAARCREQGYVDVEVALQVKRGDLRVAEGRLREAVSAYRSGLDRADRLDADNRSEAILGLIAAYRELGEIDSALALLEEQEAWVRTRSDALYRLVFDLERASLLLASQRPREALPVAMACLARAEELSITRSRLRALQLTGRCRRLLGDPETARELFEKARAVWEQERGVPLDPEWREQIGAAARDLHEEILELSLEHPADAPPAERTRRAWESLQAFKARTLEERMRGPGGAMDSPGAPPTDLTMPRLQQFVLREGELLVDTFAGRRSLFVFAVSREECRVSVSRAADLGSSLRTYYELASAPPEGSEESETVTEVLAASGVALRERLLGELSGLVASSRRVLWVPDGALNLVPLETLGIGGPERPSEPLIERAEVVRVPSASVLATLRAAPRAPRSGAERGLVIAADRGGRGGALRGAREEAKALARAFEGVDLRVSRSGPAPELDPAELADYAFLHFAAHTEVDDQYPWRSGVLLASPRPGDGGETDREGGWLRASRIAEQSLSADLAVLSGCESAGGRILSGEGVLGLTSAFLSAGVPAVVASLWPVDDRTTAFLMQEFYEELADGRCAATALRAAKQRLRRESETELPFFWAGFVLVGDGDVPVALGRKPWIRTRPATILMAGSVLAILLLLVLLRARDRDAADPV